MSDSHRLYTDLARWWPLISPPGDYAEEAKFAGDLIAQSGIVSSVLELGSGGGHNAVHLAKRFNMTLVDLSPAMLEVSRSLNPASEHVEGDMRSVRLGRSFDAVFVHDAIAYMLTEDDLIRAFETAYVHCRPGGLALFEPDHVAETYSPYTDHGGSNGDDGFSARYLEWVHPASGTEVIGDFFFVLRSSDGTVEVVHDRHRWGLFPERVWIAGLELVGFEVEVLEEVPSGDQTARRLFLGRRLS